MRANSADEGGRRDIANLNANPKANSKADPRAVRVARAVYDAVPLDAVILFGSRARGDYRADSDIDLMLVHSGGMCKDAYRTAGRAAHAAIDRLYGANRIGVDLLTMPQSTYARCRGGINHVTAQAARDGVDMNGDKQEYRPDAEPFDRHDVRQRLVNADRNLRDFAGAISAGMSQEVMGFLAQQAMENILKAWISAAGAEYRNTHELDELLNIIRRIPQEHDAFVSGGASEGLDWLTDYAVRYRYEGAVLEMDDPAELYEHVRFAVETIEGRIRALTGMAELPHYEGPGERGGDADTDG